MRQFFSKRRKGVVMQVKDCTQGVSKPNNGQIIAIEYRRIKENGARDERSKDYKSTIIICVDKYNINLKPKFFSIVKVKCNKIGILALQDEKGVILYKRKSQIKFVVSFIANCIGSKQLTR